MKKNFLKTISVGMLLTLAATSGCGLIGKKDNREKSSIVFDIPTIDELKNAGPINLKFAHAMGQANQGYIKEYADSFKVIYPNITIEQVPYGGYPALETAVTKAITDDSADLIPDIIQAYPDHLAGYMKSDKVVPITTFANNSDSAIGLKGDYAEDDLVKNYMDELSTLPLKGDFGLPFNKSSEMLTYNKTVLTKVGFTIPAFDAWTWDHVVEACKKIRDYVDPNTNTKPYAGNDVVPFMYDSLANAAITLGQQWGGEYTKVEGTKLADHILFNKDSKFKAGLEFYLEQANKGYFSIPGYFSGGKYASDPFKIQKNFMYVGSTAGATYGIPANMSDFDLDIAIVPQKAGGKKQVIQQGTNLSLLYKSSTDEAKNKTYDLQRLASWLFIRHATNKENTVHWATRTGYMPVRKSAIASTAYQQFLSNTDKSKTSYYTAAANKAAASQTDYMYFSAVFAGSSKIREEMDNAFDSIILGGKSVSEALDKAHQNIKNI